MNNEIHSGNINNAKYSYNGSELEHRSMNVIRIQYAINLWHLFIDFLCNVSYAFKH